jgi:hypothetical protein
VRIIVAALVFLVPLAAQVHFGIKGGIGFTNIAEASSAPRVSARNRTARWTVGPVVEVDLPANLGLEVNGLYRPVAYEWAFLFRTPVQPPPPLVFIKESSKVWDFPVLLKYRFPGATVRPFVGGGWTYRRFSHLPEDQAPRHGATLAAGAAIRAGVLKISPEFRYTRWPGVPELAVFRMARNQSEFLVGITL